MSFQNINPVRARTYGKYQLKPQHKWVANDGRVHQLYCSVSILAPESSFDSQKLKNEYNIKSFLGRLSIFYLTSLLTLWEFHIMYPYSAHPPVPHFLPSSLLLPAPTKGNKSKQANKKTKKKPQKQNKKYNNRKISLLPLPSCLSNTSSSILVTLEASGCHVVFLFVPPVYCRHSFFTQNRGNMERLISLLRTHYILCFLVFFPMPSSVTSPSLVISQEELCQLPSM